MNEKVTVSKWREIFRGKLWAAFGMEPIRAQNVGTFHHQKNRLARPVLAGAESERQNWTDGRWQQETPCREEPELVRHSSDLRIGGLQMRRACCVGKSDDWEHYLEEFLKDGSAYGQV